MDTQVEDIKLKTDIVSVIGERVELKKAGRNFKASCPFHGERTASFMVSPELQIFKCFGCGEGGDVFTFLEKFEGMEFSEALKYLAEKAGIKIKNLRVGQASEKEKIIELNTQAIKLYQYFLLKHEVGKMALEYLLSERGIKKETIEEFKLGYSPNQPNILKRFLQEKKKFTSKEIETAGLGISRAGGIYDRFNGRVIFPLFDHRSNPIGFAGRLLPWDKRETGKYINSPDTPAYHKSMVLFGLNVTRPFIKKKKIAIIVEGELDAISSYQAGIKNIVAIKGSSLTEEQVRLLSRFAEKFILALDSDMAGDAAARRGLVIAANLGIEVKVAKISKYKDPDEAVRNDPESYKKDLINAQGVWDFLINYVFSKNDSESGPGKAKISKEVMPILASIDDKIVQSHYINLVARKLGVSLDAVNEQLAKLKETGGKIIVNTLNSAVIEPVPKEKSRRDLLEERLLVLGFSDDPLLLVDTNVKKMLTSPVSIRILEELEKFFKTKKKFSVNEFAESLPPELFDGFSKLILNKENNFEENYDDIKKELDLVKKALKILEVKEDLKNLADEIRKLEDTNELDKLLIVQNKFNKLTKRLSGYEEEDGGSIILK